LRGGIQLLKHVFQLGVVMHAADVSRFFGFGARNLAFLRVAENVLESDGIPWVVAMAVPLGWEEGKRGC
jgi:hypothetical protein